MDFVSHNPSPGDKETLRPPNVFLTIRNEDEIRRIDAQNRVIGKLNAG